MFQITLILFSGSIFSNIIYTYNINFNLQPIPTLTGEVDNDFDSDGIAYKNMSTEQNDQLISSAQISGIEFEPNDSSHMKFEDSNGNINFMYK